MISLEGSFVRLRAVEPSDIDAMYRWENDPEVWRVSNTTAPFSRHTLEKFVEQQRFDLFESHQQRLIIERLDSEQAIGSIDLFELDALHARVGVGILIHPHQERGRGYASDALAVLERYAQRYLKVHQLWCCITQDNEASLRLFRNAGFEVCGTKHDWVWTPEGYLDELMLQKILP